MLFFHGNAMETSPFFQALDNRGFQISNEELCHAWIKMISTLSAVKSLLPCFGRQR